MTIAKFLKLGLFGTSGVGFWHFDVGLGASVLHAKGVCSIVNLDNACHAELTISCCD